MKTLKRFLSSITFLLLLFPVTSAQSSASIKGTVTDQNGGSITRAQVVLNSRSSFQLATTTRDNGEYSFKDLSPGVYLLEVRAEGFATFASEEVRIDKGEVKELNMRLSPAVVSASVVVSATGTVQRTDEVAKVVTNLDQQSIEAKHELTLAEALRGVPGVRVQQQGSTGALTTLRLRGLRNFDTAVLLDGMRVRDAGDINGSAVSLISDLVPVSLDRIEILRGSGSSIYGTHAIGGVVNMIPETPTSGYHFNTGFEAGSLHTFREHIQFSGGGQRVGFNIAANRLDVRKGIDGNDQYGNIALAGRIQVNPSSTTTLAGNFYGTIANARVNDSPFALPGAFGTSQLYPDAIAGITFEPDFNNPDQGRRNRMLTGSVRFSQLVDQRVSYSVAYQHVGSNRRNYNGPAVDPRYVAFVPFGDFEFLNVNRGNVDTFDGRVNVQFTRSNLATFGFEFEHESLFQSSQPSFTTFNNTTDRQRSYAVFGQDQLSLLEDRLQLSVGVRAQSYRVRAADRPGTLQNQSAEGSVTGDGAIAYLFRSTGTKLRAHVGNGFRAPALFERFGEGTFGSAGQVRFGDPTLKAEQSISVDAGFDQRLASDRVMFGATYFYTRLQRVIAFTGFVVDPLGLGRFSGYVNRPGGLSRGVESYVDASITKGMDLRASYTYTNSDRFVSGLGLQPEYVIPKHLFGLNWSQRYRSIIFNFDLNRTGSYIAPVFENNFPFRMAELTFAGYTKGDVFVSYERQQTETLTLVIFGGLENLFHQKYFENGFLAPRTTFRSGVNLRF
ncbi:MAG: hypothetical protein C5B55_09160 [Blastocatellia bacterium]|nr:MAG: hypothetical protein C5B55_09160 [Blastocatellia bacterium]